MRLQLNKVWSGRRGSGAPLRRLLSHLRRDRDGATAVVAALAFTGVIGFAGLGSEVGLWYYKHRTMQAAVDSAALGAAQALYVSSAADYVSEARAAVARYGLVDGQGGVSVAVNKPPLSGTYAGNAKAVEVIVQQPQTPLISAAFLSSGPTINARAVALEGAGASGCVLALDAGASAATFGNGTTGTVGSITAANSLMGTGVGQGGVLVLPSGNYVVSSPFFGNEQGAVTFGNGTSGTVGSITTANSLVGNPGDVLGFSVLSVPLAGLLGNPALTSATVYQTLFAQGKLSVPGIGPTAADLTQFGLGISSVSNQTLGAIALLSDGNAVLGSPFAFGGKGSVTFLSENLAVTGTLSAQNSVVGTGMGFGTYVHNDAPYGTFVSAAMFGGQNATTGSPVFVSGGTPKGFNTILNGMLPQANVTLSPQSIAAALASGDQLTLQSGGDIVLDSPVDLGNGNLFLVANGQIIFNNGLTLNTAFSGRPGSKFNFFSPTTNAGLESAILQITGNRTQPYLHTIPRLHIFDPGNYCVFGPAGCQAPRTPAEALAAQGNVFLGAFAAGNGRTRCYFNYPGPPAPAVTDTDAFATCP